MIKRLNNSDCKTAEQIIMLQKAAYRLEADLIGFDGIPPLLDSVESIMSCGEIFYGYYEDDCLAGLISYKPEIELLDIYRVAVHPDYFRRGIASKLIGFLEENCDKSKITVSTALKNTPAVTLYRAMGFQETMQWEAEKGLVLVSFEKELD